MSQALKLAANDETFRVEDIKLWRSEQKSSIWEMNNAMTRLEDELEKIKTHEEKEIMRKRAQKQVHEEEEMMRKQAIEYELERRRRAVQDEDREREEQWLRKKMYIQQQCYQQPEKDREKVHSLQAQTQFSPQPPLLQRRPLQPEQLNPTATGWHPQTTADTTQSSTRSTTPVQSAMPAIQPTTELNQSDSTTQQLLQMLQQQISLNQQQQMHPRSTATGTATVKLPKYTITPFKGEYRDWMRFWNQFSVEVDENSQLAEISKFNYLMEFVKGKPRDDITGLPHTAEGYEEAKSILERKYGRGSKVKRAVLKELEDLEPISHNTSNRLERCHQFYDKLSKTVRTLATMNALASAESNVYQIMDKLGPIREFLIQRDDYWEEWGLQDLVDNLERYVERNPLPTKREEHRRPHGGDRDKQRHERGRDKPRHEYGRDKRDHAMMGKSQQNCLYCGSPQHRSYQCDKILDVAARKEILLKLKACFNCTATTHQAAKCPSKRGCFKCGQRHHTSLCQNKESTIGGANVKKPTVEKTFCSNTNSVIHPSAIVKVGDIDARIAIDTMSGSNYICSDLITKLNLKPKRREKRIIEQMFGTINKLVEIYEIEIRSKTNNRRLKIECINVERDFITVLLNPLISEVKKQQPRIRRLTFTEEDSSGESLPVHILLGVRDYQKIRTSEQPVLGLNPQTDPVAEYTQFGWILFGASGEKQQRDICHFTMTGQEQFEQLCKTDVLGLEEPVKSDDFDHEVFKEQIQQNNDGQYTTRLPWKPNQVPLPDNKPLSYGRLQSTTKKLERMGKLGDYHAIMQEQFSLGMLELVPKEPSDTKVHYIPHHPVIKEDSETTPLRIVYDCSAKPNLSTPSLNDCLETGPPLQPHLFDVLLRNRFRRFIITGDIKKAFHQIHLQAEDRDVQRVLWYNNLQDRQVMEYRFTRVIFGATSSPYILGATIEKHLEQYGGEFSERTKRSLKEDTYVDDVQGGGDTIEDVQSFKEEATTLLKEGGFQLYKWHSNIKEMDGSDNQDEKPNKIVKILGIQWDKENDTLSVSADIPSGDLLTKRKVLSAINSVYDVLGWASPLMVSAKLIFSEICIKNYHWDDKLPEDVSTKWDKWRSALAIHNTVTVPRSVCTTSGSTFELHGFADASKYAVCAAIYVVEYKMDIPVSQNLLVAKSRVAKPFSIPRLELIAALTLAKLQTNVISALDNPRVRDFHYWSDSTTVLHWLADRGTWSVFVRNRANKINELSHGKWRYVPTTDNPSDLGTRGIPPVKLGDLWFKGPSWLPDRDNWPEQPEIVETNDALTEKVKPKLKCTSMMSRSESRDFIQPHPEEEVLGCSAGDSSTKQLTQEFMNEMLQRFNYWKMLRISAWIQRFKRNCLGQRHKGPLTSEEINKAETSWIVLVQQEGLSETKKDKLQDEHHVWRVDSRIPGYEPILLPQKGEFTRRLVEHFHYRTLHGGVQSTMSKIRERFWIPKLRTLVKSLVHRCNLCKKHRVKKLNAPAVGGLPNFRAEFTTPFSATGVDFAGPLYYKIPQADKGGRYQPAPEKSYVALFTCAATRAVHLRLVKSMSAAEFKRIFKEFTARRATPSIMVSDNAKTFQATKFWIENLVKDHDLYNYLCNENIEWKFNLSRAPWWGGFYERLVGIMKKSLSKSIGQALLTFDELEEALLDVECFINNRPICYVGDECDEPILTPNILLRGTPARFLEEDLENLNYTDETTVVTRRIRYFKKTREQLKKRWMHEYLHALQERHPLIPERENNLPQPGSVVMITDSLDAMKPKWTIGKVVSFIKGRDNVIRGFKIKVGSGYTVERPLQLVRDLEISGAEPETTTEPSEPDPTSNDDPEPRETRPTRQAKREASDRLTGIFLNEHEDQ